MLIQWSAMPNSADLISLVNHIQYTPYHIYNKTRGPENVYFRVLDGFFFLVYNMDIRFFRAHLYVQYNNITMILYNKIWYFSHISCAKVVIGI